MDTILAGAAGRLAPGVFGEAGHFVAGMSEQLAAGNLAGSGNISAERAHRLAAMQVALPAAVSRGTVLYTWSQGLDPGVTVHGDGGETAERQVLTLAAAPVEIRQPARGVSFTVPPAFIRIGNFRLGAADDAVV